MFGFLKKAGNNKKRTKTAKTEQNLAVDPSILGVSIKISNERRPAPMKKHIHNVCGGSTTAGLKGIENATELLRILQMGS